MGHVKKLINDGSGLLLCGQMNFHRCDPIGSVKISILSTLQPGHMILYLPFTINTQCNTICFMILILIMSDFENLKSGGIHVINTCNNNDNSSSEEDSRTTDPG